ncbi:MAG: ATP synthase subunit I [Deltaproteobacteria bacterium]|nr:ATP synthase subunit I [Deltaproteobacteria bacterium]
MRDIQKLVDFITTSNWLILLFGGIIGLVMTPMKFAFGIILGGLIVAINFHLLKNTLKKMFRPEVVSERGHSVVSNVMVKYYIRFAISGTVIFLLISKHIVHPLGLLAGLSVVVASMFMATVLELTRLFFKEAV